MKIKYKGFIALTIALTELSLLPVLLSIGGKSIGTIPQFFYAFLIGSATSLIVSYKRDRLAGLIDILKAPGNMPAIILVAGLLNDVISQLLLGVGTLGTNPIIAATVFRSWVIMAALLVPIILKQRVTKIQFLAVLLGFVGVYLIATNGTLININSSSLPFIFVLLGSALCVVYPNLVMKKYNFDLFGAIALFNLSSLAFMVMLALATGTSLAVQFNPNTIFIVAFLGIATYGIGTSLYYYSLKTFGVLFVGNSILSVPFITMLLSYFILGTPVYQYYISAALLLSIGIVVQGQFIKAPEHIKQRNTLGNFYVFDITSAFANNKGKTISNYICGDRKALAITLPWHFDLKDQHKDIFAKNNCIVFTDRQVHNEAKTSEMEFINSIIDAPKENTIIIGMGYEEKLESSFDDLIKSIAYQG